MSYTHPIASVAYDLLQKAFDKALQEVPWRLGTEIVLEKIRASGIEPSEEDAEKISSWLKTGAEGTLDLGYASDVLSQIELNDDDWSQLKRAQTKFSENIPALLATQIETSSNESLDDLRKRWAAESASQKLEIGQFIARLGRRWNSGLEPLRMLLTIARESGSGTHSLLLTTSTLR